MITPATIKGVDIDFHPRPRPSLAGVLVLIVATLLSAVCLNQWLDNRRMLQSLQDGLGTIEREQRQMSALSAQAAARQPDDAVIEQWVAVNRSLHQPWFALLSQVERTLSDEVAVLQFKPDLAAKKVHLLIEARDVPAALDWLERVGRTQVLQEPRLVAQRLQMEKAGQPVQVQVSVELP